MQAALEFGPVTVAIDAGSLAFRFYKHGIFDSKHRCGTALNHAVTVVGYSSMDTDSTPYWIVRNSWGSDWGEDGYVRMEITGGAGICGINLEPTLPNVYYLSVFDSVTYLTLCIIGALLSVYTLIKLSWCKPEHMLYLHDGQKSLVTLSYGMVVFYVMTAMIFAISLGSTAMPTWMIYRSALFMLFAAVHFFLCMMHFQMG